MGAVIWNSNFGSGSSQARCEACNWDGTKHMGAGRYSWAAAQRDQQQHDNQNHSEE